MCFWLKILSKYFFLFNLLTLSCLFQNAPSLLAKLWKPEEEVLHEALAGAVGVGASHHHRAHSYLNHNHSHSKGHSCHLLGHLFMQLSIKNGNLQKIVHSSFDQHSFLSFHQQVTVWNLGFVFIIVYSLKTSMLSQDESRHHLCSAVSSELIPPRPCGPCRQFNFKCVFVCLSVKYGNRYVRVCTLFLEASAAAYATYLAKISSTKRTQLCAYLRCTHYAFGQLDMKTCSAC